MYTNVRHLEGEGERGRGYRVKRVKGLRVKG